MPASVMSSTRAGSGTLFGGAVGSVVVEVDMLDSEKDPFRTGQLKVGRGGAVSVNVGREYDAGERSKLGKAFAKALESPSEEDSEVQFVVYGQAKDEKEVELGVARCSLERLVNKGKDHDGVLEVMLKRSTTEKQISWEQRDTPMETLFPFSCMSVCLLLAPPPQLAIGTWAPVEHTRCAHRQAQDVRSFTK